MPQLGETVTEGTITRWLKQVGEHVDADEPLFEVSTDKVDSEVPAPIAGVVSEILVPEGETVEVGTRLAVLGDSAGAPAAAPAPAPAAEAPAPAPAPAEAAAPPPPPEPPSAAPAPPPAAEAPPTPPAPPPAPTPVPAPEPVPVQPDPPPSPVPPPEPEPAPPPAPAPIPSAAAAPAGARDETIPFDNIRRRTAEHMVRSKATSAHVYTSIEVDYERVDRARRAHRDQWKAREGFSLTYLPFIARAFCDAVVEFPNVNASVDG